MPALPRRRRPRLPGLVLGAVASLAPATAAAAASQPGDPTYSQVASQVAGRPVQAICDTSVTGWDHPDAMGYVKFTRFGPADETHLHPHTCARLDAFTRGVFTHDAMRGIHTLTHEAMHMSGIRNEERTDCAALQRNHLTAHLLGATHDQALTLAHRFYAHTYPDRDPDYVDMRRCRPDGAWDEHLEGSVFTAPDPHAPLLVAAAPQEPAPSQSGGTTPQLSPSSR